jgi:glycosyltransferase 2 family protein
MPTSPSRPALVSPLVKQAGRLAALAGFALALWLIWRDHPANVLALMRAAGAGLLLAAAAHVLPMLANAKDWQTLVLPRKDQPGWLAMLRLVWVRESINGLLPVARIGGELVSFRLLRGLGLSQAQAGACLVGDMQLTLISQALFATAGVAYLLTATASGTLRLAGDLAWGLAALTPILILFALVQHASPFERAMRLLDRVMSGKLGDLVGQSAQVDQAIKAIWQQRGVVGRYLFIWQPLQHLGTSLEIWLTLHFLGTPVSLLQALVIEALIQAISSAAFFVPAGLGVQEGGFVLIGGALGLDATACLGLAGARRLRDLLIYVPGLIAWQASEASVTRAASSKA